MSRVEPPDGRKPGTRAHRGCPLRVCGALLLWLSSSGCITGGYATGHEVPADLVAKIELGVTTRSEVLDWFGSPLHFTDATTLGRALDATDLTPEDVIGIPFADVLVFRRTKGRLSGLILILYNTGTWKIASDTLVVYFDDDDRVLYYGYSEETRALD